MNYWNSLKLKTKLMALTIFMAIIIVVVATNSWFGLNNVNQSRKNITDISIPNLLVFSKMDLAFRSLRIELRTLGLPNLTQEQSQSAIEGIHKYIKNFEDAKDEYLKQDFLPGEEELFKPLLKEWEDFKLLGGNILKYNSSSNLADKEKMITIFKVDCPEAASKVDNYLTKLNSFHRDTAEGFIKDAEFQTKQSSFLSILIGSIGILLGLLVGVLISNKTSQTISSLSKALYENSEGVATASSQIALSSTNLSEAATEQSASLEQTAASLEEITAMISKASESADQTFNSSEQSQEKATQGKHAVEEMVHSMEEINQSNQDIMNQINTSNEQLTEIVRVIQEIGNKTKVINEIVFQTKLLSFNASVEAARAGEHGKGFAVVAEEVGNLAQMSGNAAKEITEMLDGSILKVESIVSNTKNKVENLVDNGKVKVDQGIRVAANCSVILGEIVQNVSHVSNLAREISQATKEQSQGVKEINKAMAQLDSVTQQNSSASNETALESQGLSKRADELKSLIEELVFTVDGKSQEKSSLTKKDFGAKIENPISTNRSTNTEIRKSVSKNRNTSTATIDKSSMPGFNDPRFRDI